jgi:hypothetical protein
VTDIVAQVPATIEALTGIDLMSALKELPGLKPADDMVGDSENATEEETPSEADHDEGLST